MVIVRSFRYIYFATLEGLVLEEIYFLRKESIVCKSFPVQSIPLLSSGFQGYKNYEKIGSIRAFHEFPETFFKNVSFQMLFFAVVV